MNEGLKAYLEKCNTKPVEPELLEKYKTVMKEETIPKIIADIKKNREAVFEFRFSPRKAS